MTQRAIQYWVIPPEENAEFVAAMEEVLDVYAQPYDAEKAVICMDEQPVQLVKERRMPLPATNTSTSSAQEHSLNVLIMNMNGQAPRVFLCLPSLYQVGGKRRCVLVEPKPIGHWKLPLFWKVAMRIARV